MIYVLYGQPGSGKTSLGKLLASHLDTPFIIDGDEFRRMFSNTNFEKSGREDNIRAANTVATYISKVHSIDVIQALVNPYERLRAEVRANNSQVIEILLESDRDLRRGHHVDDAPFHPPFYLN